MSRLFISLYLDQDISALIGKLIQSRGYAVTTTLQAAQTCKTDAEQLDFATARQMAIVTHNRDDFRRLATAYSESGKIHCGIIIAVRRSPYEIARRLMLLLNRATAEEMDNQLLYI